MRANCGVYPRLGRYFKTAQELADAATMSRPTLLAVLKGNRAFTWQEKRAICDRLAIKVLKQEIDDLTLKELIYPNSTEFDELFKTKEYNL